MLKSQLLLHDINHYMRGSVPVILHSLYPDFTSKEQVRSKIHNNYYLHQPNSSLTQTRRTDREKTWSIRHNATTFRRLKTGRLFF